MSNNMTGSLNSLKLACSRFDRAFSEGLVVQVVEQFSEGAQMLWPVMEDIVGRDAIRTALEGFSKQFTTLSFSHDRQLIELCGNKAFTIGRFEEDLVPNSGGLAQRVHGRMVELWENTERDEWELVLLLTGRYAENEILTER